MTQNNTVSNLTEAKANLNAAYRTYQFFAANKSKRRVMIAEDVIAQIKRKTFLAESGTYYAEGPDNKSCTVCALGACFAASKGLGVVEDYDEEGPYGREEMDKALRPYFTTEQLDLIETAFERRVYGSSHDDDKYYRFDEDNMKLCTNNGYPVGNDRYALGRAINFGNKYNSDTKRMIAIMQNIVDNNGKFCP